MAYFRRKFCFDILGLIPFSKFKITVINDDITKIKSDVIVNSANKTLLGGRGVDGAIHKAAGPELKEECAKLGGCNEGEAKITKSYGIKHIKGIIHMVVPKISGSLSDSEKNLLRNCYLNSLEIAKNSNMRRIIFPDMGTGILRQLAPKLAVNTILEWLSIGNNFDMVEEIIICTSSIRSKKIYENILDFFK
jgi:O-acetyl-ADP-ribose deacetylase (regulator of RNase III)